MQSDTIIGIVGAVVLVVVMVGVFAFEYNNAPGGDGDTNGDGNGMTDAEKKAAFNETYPVLAYDEDIDGDGTANWNDTDIDGDGTPNAEDNRTRVRFDSDDGLGGTVDANNGQSSSETNTFFAGRGNQITRVWVNYTVATGLTGDAVNPLQISLETPEGDSLSCTTQTDASGPSQSAAATCMFDITNPVTAGGFTLTVTDPNAVVQRDFDAVAVVDY